MANSIQDTAGHSQIVPKLIFFQGTEGQYLEMNYSVRYNSSDCKEIHSWLPIYSEEKSTKFEFNVKQKTRFLKLGLLFQLPS